MELNLRNALQNLDRRLRSSTNSQDWLIVVYSVDPSGPGRNWRLQRVESLGTRPDEVIELVANAAWVTRTTIVGDIAKIAQSLREPSEMEKYHFLGVNHVAAGVSGRDAHGCAIAAPCFDPWQTATSDRVPRRAIGALAVAGELPAQEAVANDTLRYLIEQYAKTIASLLDPSPRGKYSFDSQGNNWFEEWTLPDIEVMSAQNVPAHQSSGQVGAEPSKVPKYWRVLKVLPNEAVRIFGYSKDFEPYETRGETWLQFGPGLAVSKTGLESFVRGWTQRKADKTYVQKLNSGGSSGDW